MRACFDINVGNHFFLTSSLELNYRRKITIYYSYSSKVSFLNAIFALGLVADLNKSCKYQ